MWNHLRSGIVGGIVAGAVILAGSAVAGSGIGGVFNLGDSNTVSQTSVLAGSTAGDQLDVANVNAGSSARGLGVLGKSPTAPAVAATNSGGGPALALTVNSGTSPFTVSSATKVANLNADRLDGLDASAFPQQASGKTTTITNRIVIPANTGTPHLLFDVPALGEVSGVCYSDSNTPGPASGAVLEFRNQSGSLLDLWRGNYSDGRPRGSFIANNDWQMVGQYLAGSQWGESFAVGFGSAPGFRRVLSVQFNLFQVGQNANCGIQATATLWSSQ